MAEHRIGSARHRAWQHRMDSPQRILAWLAGSSAPSDRGVLVVAAHPDDETIGFGGQLPRFSDVTVLHVTNGAPRDGLDAARCGFCDTAAYAATRRQEALAALALGGVAEVWSLGVSDQEAALRLLQLSRAIAARILLCRPAMIVTHAYEGGHPDHDATAFAVRAALRMVSRRVRPVLLEMAGYHAYGVGDFLAAPDCPSSMLALSDEACTRKRRMLDCFATQREVLAAFPVGIERLRHAPAYDFTRPPHAGKLHYERFPWGMSGRRFCELAAAAMLGLDRHVGAGCA